MLSQPGRKPCGWELGPESTWAGRRACLSLLCGEPCGGRRDEGGQAENQEDGRGTGREGQWKDTGLERGSETLASGE